MAYTLSPLDTPNGVRYVQVDISAYGRLKPEELLSSVSITSRDTTALTISSAAVNTTILTKDDGVSKIKVGRGATFTASAARKYTGNVEILVKYTGDDGTVGSEVIIQPLFIP